MATILSFVLTIMGPLSAAAGMICLFHGSFSEDQFGDDATLKAVFFTILAFVFGALFYYAQKLNDFLEKVCHKHHFVKGLVKFLLLVCTSTVNLLIKYHRFNFHSGYTKCSFLLSHKSQFNLYSAGLFSIFALVVSSKTQKAMELGVFDFLLGLTMDASMEISGKDGPNLWYMLGAYVYCALLIAMRTYLESLMVNRHISIDDQQQLVIVNGAVIWNIRWIQRETDEDDEETTGLKSETTSYIDEESESETPQDTTRLIERFVEKRDGGHKDQWHKIKRDGMIAKLRNLRIVCRHLGFHILFLCRQMYFCTLRSNVLSSLRLDHLAIRRSLLSKKLEDSTRRRSSAAWE